MAKFRQNHTRTGKRPFAGLLVRVVLMLLIFTVLFVLAYRYSDELTSFQEGTEFVIEVSSESYVPEFNTYEEVHHNYYSLGYDESIEQARWVTYQLTRESLKIPNVPRADRFLVDPLVSSRSAKHNDYSGSGYSRGHLAPAGDMAFSEKAMQESFYMSNMTPQISGFNGGIWRELEETVRDWAYQNGELYVATGPIFTKVTKKIGKTSKVGVPDAFYKIIVDKGKGSEKGIAFLIPHEVSDQHLRDYVVSIDEIEEVIKLDFFDELYRSERVEKKVESEVSIGQWPFSTKRFETRINHWNHN